MRPWAVEASEPRARRTWAPEEDRCAACCVVQVIIFFFLPMDGRAMGTVDAAVALRSGEEQKMHRQSVISERLREGRGPFRTRRCRRIETTEPPRIELLHGRVASP